MEGVSSKDTFSINLILWNYKNVFNVNLFIYFFHFVTNIKIVKYVFLRDTFYNSTKSNLC